jgi:hypothetical protein
MGMFISDSRIVPFHKVVGISILGDEYYVHCHAMKSFTFKDFDQLEEYKKWLENLPHLRNYHI